MASRSWRKSSPGGQFASVRAAADHAAAYFTDPTGYVQAALYGHVVTSAVSPVSHWTASGVGIGLLSVALAVAVAGGGLYGGRLADRAGFVAGPGTRAYAGMRRLHSGHIGDYVAWLMTGMAVLAALVGLPLIRS